MMLSFIYAIGFEAILASFYFQVGLETGMWVVSQASIYILKIKYFQLLSLDFPSGGGSQAGERSPLIRP
jgi:hypothetical protein